MSITADEIASVESAEKNASLQSKLTELSSKALEVQKFAAEELKKRGADLKEFLANRGIIPAEKFITPQEYAAQMTPGDAKALVQELIRLYQTYRRLNAGKEAIRLFRTLAEAEAWLSESSFRSLRGMVRAQDWMLVVMVGFTCLALWILSAVTTTTI